MTEIFTDRKFLITGAAGFIGANLIRRLLNLGAEIHALVRPTTHLWRLESILPNIQLHQVELSDRNSVAGCVNEIYPDYVCHLAVQGVNPSQRVYDQMLNTSVIGTLNLLEALANIPFRRMIHMGGSTEYGRKQSPMAETDFLEPISFYGAVKAAATMLVGQFARAHQKPIVTVRPFSVYGCWEAPHRFIPTALRAALKHQELPLTSPGICHDFIFIDDVVEGVILALQASDLQGEIINLGTGHQISNEEVVEVIQSITGRTIHIRPDTYPVNAWDTSTWVADCQKARHLLSWEARHSIRTGLENTWSWFQDHLALYV